MTAGDTTAAESACNKRHRFTLADVETDAAIGAVVCTDETVPRSGIQPSIRHTEPRAWTLLQLPREVLVLVLCWLDVRSLMRFASTCTEFHRERMTSAEIEEALRLRAARRGHVNPVRLPDGTNSWVAHLAWQERRREEAHMPVAAGTDCSFFVAGGGCLMSCGEESDMGELGHEEDVWLHIRRLVVSVPTMLPSTAHIRFSQVSATVGSAVALSATGKVFTWGCGNDGLLGHGDEKSIGIPRQLNDLDEHAIMSVTTGGLTCMAVTERGEVFMWGKDVSSRETLLRPRRIEGALTGVRVRSTSIGQNHCLIVTEEGRLFAFGSPKCCGHKSFSFKLQVVRALCDVRIVAVAAGWFHSLALSADGTVFAWGANRNGQLGLSRCDDEYVKLPQTIVTLNGRNVCAVAASDDTSFAVTTAGELYSWGDGRFGKLGHGDTDDQLAPKRVDALLGERVSVVSSGCKHTIAVSRDGSVFGWGKAEGLGLPKSAAAFRQYFIDAEGNPLWDYGCVVSPHRYAKLSGLQRI